MSIIIHRIIDIPLPTTHRYASVPEFSSCPDRPLLSSLLFFLDPVATKYSNENCTLALSFHEAISTYASFASLPISSLDQSFSLSGHPRGRFIKPRRDRTESTATVGYRQPNTINPDPVAINSLTHSCGRCPLITIHSSKPLAVAYRCSSNRAGIAVLILLLVTWLNLYGVPCSFPAATARKR